MSFYDDFTFFRSAANYKEHSPKGASEQMTKVKRRQFIMISFFSSELQQITGNTNSLIY